MNTLDYFLKANLYGLLFAGCYWLLLRRHTFFGLNRAYLLTSALLSLILPLVSLPTQTVETLPRLDWPVPVPVGIISLPAAAVAITPVESAPVAAQPDWEQLGMMAYDLIALFFVIRFSVRVRQLLRLIRQSHQRAHEDYVLVQPTDPTIPTFSFFRYVLLNPADTHNNLIIQHELVHVRQYHSADVVSMNLLRAMFWGCPALSLIDHLLRQVHEFLADKPASQPTEYARFLVDYSFGAQPSLNEPAPLTNSFFNPSLLKQRILMLHRKATNRWALGKYALVFPLAFGLLAMTSTREDIAGMVSQTDNETITVSGRVTSAVDGKPLPGAIVAIKNTTHKTTTDSDGKYKLTNVSKDASLVVSFVGFTLQEVKVSGQTILTISMTLPATNLNKVVVTADEPVYIPKSQRQIDRNDEIFTVVEQQPEFPGGLIALERYLAQSLHYPIDAQKAHVEGYVFVQFVISESGSIQRLRVLRGIGFGCNEEAVRVVSQMPKWTPGKQQGKAVAVQYNLPIQFVLEKKEDKRAGRADPTTKADSSQKMSVIIDNSRNGRFALYNDLSPSPILLSDSLRRSETISRILASRLNTGEPLYLIDGIEASKATVNRLDPKNIESIDVLKHGAAIYGPKAIHGAVIITTRKK